MATVTTVVSTRGGELAELVANAAGAKLGGEESVGKDDAGAGVEGGTGGAVSRLGSLDDFDGIVVVGGDGTFFEVLKEVYGNFTRHM